MANQFEVLKDLVIRPSGRSADATRNITIELHPLKNAVASCLIKCGNTHVICAASMDERVPHFIKNTGSGWITAEYSMLPLAAASRIQRESQQGKVGGRTHEIQRLIGRSLRSIVDFAALGERNIIVDCDVINADGGTRTAAITGGYVALHLLCNKLLAKKVLKRNPIIGQVAAISCGIINNKPLLDLDYMEDSNADVDANFVMTNEGKLVEVQATAERNPFSESEFFSMYQLAGNAIKQLIKLQKEVLENEK